MATNRSINLWRVTAVTVAVISIAVTFASGAVTATAVTSKPTTCSTSFDVYQVPVTQLQSCGITTYPLLSVESRVDGGHQYEFQVGSSVVTYLVPPSSFDPNTASENELATYGIPARPTDASLLADWNTRFANVRYVTPPPFLATVPVTANATSNIWSGYKATAGGYANSTVTWTEPALGSSRCSNNSVVIWAGLGGWNVSTLAQDGTAENAPGIGQNQAWSEVLPAQTSIIPTNLYATVGQGFEAYVQYDSGTGSTSKFTFFMDNLYSGATQMFNVTANGYSGATAEAIVERPTVGGVPTNLSNYGTMTFNSAYIDGTAMNSQSHTGIDMYDGSTLLAAANSIGSGGAFTDTQHSCN
jgi:hypothetical protein